jgi:hypothetical protein
MSYSIRKQNLIHQIEISKSYVVKDIIRYRIKKQTRKFDEHSSIVETVKRCLVKAKLAQKFLKWNVDELYMYISTTREHNNFESILFLYNYVISTFTITKLYSSTDLAQFYDTVCFSALLEFSHFFWNSNFFASASLTKWLLVEMPKNCYCIGFAYKIAKLM